MPINTLITYVHIDTVRTCFGWEGNGSNAQIKDILYQYLLYMYKCKSSDFFIIDISFFSKTHFLFLLVEQIVLRLF